MGFYSDPSDSVGESLGYQWALSEARGCPEFRINRSYFR